MTADIRAVTTAQFETEVIEASRTRPVLVDFWAPWCGPCRMLAPVLEEIAAELGERLRVVKVNTDEEPELAQRFDIRGIPAVKLFRDGKVVAEFVGVYPPAAVRAFIAPHLPRESDAMRTEALARAEAGDPETAARMLREVFEKDPENVPAVFDLIRVLTRAGRPDEARKVLDSLPAAVQLQPEARTARAHIHVATVAALAPESAAESSDTTSRRAAAARALLKGDVTGALDRWLELMQTDRRFARNEGKEDLLQAFELVGHEDPRVAQYRRRMASLLH